MADRERPGAEPLATLTHARLRAEQGDLAGARRILDRLLRLEPRHGEALRLLEALGRPAAGDREGEPQGGRRARIRRLERWLARVHRRGAAQG